MKYIKNLNLFFLASRDEIFINNLSYSLIKMALLETTFFLFRAILPLQVPTEEAFLQVLEEKIPLKEGIGFL